MNLHRYKEILLESGLASEMSLVLGILLVCLWVYLVPRSAFGIAFWICLFSIGCSFFLAGFTPTEGRFFSLGFDPWTGYLKRFFAVSASAALFGYLEWKNGRSISTRPELLILLMVSQLSLSVLVQARDFGMMFFAAEGFSLCAYGLSRPALPGKLQSESVLKYFASGSLASAVGLFGLTWILGFKGTLLEPSNDILVSAAFFPVAGAVFFISFLLFKLGGFPFHFWVPGVFEEAPTPLSGYMAAAPKVAAAFALLNLVSFLETNLTFPLLILSLIGSLLGNLAALRATRIRNLLAFSAIGQAGLLLIPAIFSRQISGAEVHLLVFGVGYAVAVQGAFSAVQYFENHLKDGLSIADLAGQYKNHPFPSLAFILLVLSLVGIPPTVGFLGKLLVFSGIPGGGNLYPGPVLYLLFGLGLITTLISMAYYLKIPFQLIFGVRLLEEHVFRNSSASLLWMVLAGLFVLFAFFRPEAMFPVF